MKKQLSTVEVTGLTRALIRFGLSKINFAKRPFHNLFWVLTCFSIIELVKQKKKKQINEQ